MNISIEIVEQPHAVPKSEQKAREQAFKLCARLMLMGHKAGQVIVATADELVGIHLLKRDNELPA